MKKKEKTAILELNKKTDLLATKFECRNCGYEYLYGVPYVFITCRRCGKTSRTDFSQDIYTKKARQKDDMISYNDKLIIRADEKYKAQLNDMRQNFIEQHCYDVSEISNYTKEYRKCLSCGVCMDCLTCKNCGKAFRKDINKRKQICPHCRTNDFVRTYFKNVIISEENREIKLCPFCKSSSIKMTMTSNKTKCHLCGSRKLTEKRSKVVFETTIERKKQYRRENV